VKVSLSSTSLYSIQAAESIKDLSPNAADVMVTSVITSMVTDLGVVSPTAGGLLTYYDGGNGVLILLMDILFLQKILMVMIMRNIKSQCHMVVTSKLVKGAIRLQFQGFIKF